MRKEHTKGVTKRPRNPLIDFMIFLKRRDYKYQMPLLSASLRYRAYNAVDINQADRTLNRNTQQFREGFYIVKSFA